MSSQPVDPSDDGAAAASAAVSAATGGGKSALVSTLDFSDQKMQQLGLPNDEVMCGEFECQLHSQFRPHGILYVTQRRLLFEPSSLLGAKKRQQLMFKDIVSVTKGKSGALRVDTAAKRGYEFGSFQDAAVAYDIVQCMYKRLTMATTDVYVFCFLMSFLFLFCLPLFNCILLLFCVQ